MLYLLVEVGGGIETAGGYVPWLFMKIAARNLELSDRSKEVKVVYRAGELSAEEKRITGETMSMNVEVSQGTSETPRITTVAARYSMNSTAPELPDLVSISRQMSAIVNGKTVSAVSPSSVSREGWRWRGNTDSAAEQIASLIWNFDTRGREGSIAAALVMNEIQAERVSSRYHGLILQALSSDGAGTVWDGRGVSLQKGEAESQARVRHDLEFRRAEAATAARSIHTGANLPEFNEAVPSGRTYKGKLGEALQSHVMDKIPGESAPTQVGSPLHLPDGFIRQGVVSSHEFADSYESYHRNDISLKKVPGTGQTMRERLKILLIGYARNPLVRAMLSERDIEELEFLVRKLNSIAIYGFVSICKGQDDYILGLGQFEEEELFLAEDVMSRLHNDGSPLVLDEYLLHMLILPIVKHYPSIYTLQTHLPENYPNRQALRLQATGKSGDSTDSLRGTSITAGESANSRGRVRAENWRDLISLLKTHFETRNYNREQLLALLSDVILRRGEYGVGRTLYRGASFETEDPEDMKFRVLMSDIMAAAMLGQNGDDIRTFLTELDQNLGRNLPHIATRNLAYVAGQDPGPELDQLEYKHLFKLAQSHAARSTLGDYEKGHRDYVIFSNFKEQNRLIPHDANDPVFGHEAGEDILRWKKMQLDNSYSWSNGAEYRLIAVEDWRNEADDPSLRNFPNTKSERANGRFKHDTWIPLIPGASPESSVIDVDVIMEHIGKVRTIPDGTDEIRVNIGDVPIQSYSDKPSNYAFLASIINLRQRLEQDYPNEDFKCVVRDNNGHTGQILYTNHANWNTEVISGIMEKDFPGHYRGGYVPTTVDRDGVEVLEDMPTVVIIHRATARTINSRGEEVPLPEASLTHVRRFTMKGASLLAGIGLAVMDPKTQAIFTTDADGSTDVQMVGQAKAAMSRGTDVVLASKYASDSILIGRSNEARFQSKVYNGFLRVFQSLKSVLDTQTGFKGFNLRAAKNLVKRANRTANSGYGYDTGFISLSIQAGMSVRAMPVSWLDSPVESLSKSVQQDMAYQVIQQRQVYTRGTFYYYLNGILMILGVIFLILVAFQEKVLKGEGPMSDRLSVFMDYFGRALMFLFPYEIRWLFGHRDVHEGQSYDRNYLTNIKNGLGAAVFYSLLAVIVHFVGISLWAGGAIFALLTTLLLMIGVEKKRALYMGLAAGPALVSIPYLLLFIENLISWVGVLGVAAASWVGYSGVVSASWIGYLGVVSLIIYLGLFVYRMLEIKNMAKDVRQIIPAALVAVGLITVGAVALWGASTSIAGLTVIAKFILIAYAVWSLINVLLIHRKYKFDYVPNCHERKEVHQSTIKKCQRSGQNPHPWQYTRKKPL